jgi:hypothetical protein
MGPKTKAAKAKYGYDINANNVGKTNDATANGAITRAGIKPQDITPDMTSAQAGRDDLGSQLQKSKMIDHTKPPTKNAQGQMVYTSLSGAPIVQGSAKFNQAVAMEKPGQYNYTNADTVAQRRDQQIGISKESVDAQLPMLTNEPTIARIVSLANYGR